MQRRAVIVSAAGTFATLAGCLDTRRSDLGSATPTTEPTETADVPSTATDTPTPSADVTIESVHLQYGVVTPTSPDSIGVSNTDTPYLVLSVRVNGALSWEGFGLQMGEVSYTPSRLDRLYRTSWGDDHWYELGRTQGLVLFEAPSNPTTRLRVTWPGGEHPIDDDIVARLKTPTPQFSASLDVPSSHEHDTAPPVTIEVTNEEETVSRFLGALNRVGPRIAYAPVTRLSRLVPPGDTVAISVSDSWTGMPSADSIGDGKPDVTYHLDFAGGEDSGEIRLINSS